MYLLFEVIVPYYFILKPQNILTAINNLVSDIGLNDVKTSFDSKTGIASVIGNKDGVQYTTTLTKHNMALCRHLRNLQQI